MEIIFDDKRGSVGLLNICQWEGKRWEEEQWSWSSLWGDWPPLGAPLMVRPVVFEHWRSWVTPVSRLISQHQVESLGGMVGGVSTPTTALHKTSCVRFLPQARKKNHWKGDETAKFVYQGGKLISEVKGKACMPLKQKRSRSALKPCLNNTLNCRPWLKLEYSSCTIMPLLSYLQDRSVVWVAAWCCIHNWSLQLVMDLHANIGESLPPCGGR